MRQMLLALVLLSVMCIVGCGGSSTTPAPSPPPQNTATITGQLTDVANPSDYEIYINGQRMSVAPGQDGRFLIENVPPGSHTVRLVAPDGMAGAHFSCETSPGAVTDVGPVVPVAGGQIAGMVAMIEEDGSLTILAGVEVIADPDFFWVDDGDDGVVEPGPASVDSSPPSSGDAVQLRAITDERGSYLMPAVPSGSYVVTVNVPGLEQGVVWVWVEPGRTAVADFQLRGMIEPGVGTVVGTVRAVSADGDRVPIEGATVEIGSDSYAWTPTPPVEPVVVEAVGKALIPPMYYFNQFRTLTDSQGRYSLNVPSGYLSISVWADGYGMAWESIVVLRGERQIRDYTLQSWEEPVDSRPPGAAAGR